MGVNRHKILLCQYSEMLNTFLKTHLQRMSFTSLNPKSNMYEYKDKVSRRRITCRLVKLKLAFEVINPQLVVDHAIKEQELEDLTITKCGNNVHMYLTTIQEKRNEINANLPDSEEYPNSSFHTNMFTQLEKYTCNDFLTNVKDTKSRWIKSPDTFDQATEIGDLIKLYTNYSLTGTWMKSNGKDAKIITMANKLYKEKLKNSRPNDRSNRPGKKSRVNPRQLSSKRTPLDPWRFAFDGKTKTVSGVKY